MIALDTNILARFYVNDPTDTEGASQRALVRRLFAVSNSMFVPLTVILELEWVLRGHYKFSAQDVHTVFEHLAGLPNMTVENWIDVREASTLSVQGFDFSDALHWRLSQAASALVTFDRTGFANRAKKAKLQPPIQILDSVFVGALERSA
jgi:predicted nucleic-acid-binding protein